MSAEEKDGRDRGGERLRDKKVGECWSVVRGRVTGKNIE